LLKKFNNLETAEKSYKIDNAKKNSFNWNIKPFAKTY
jgi:hypothetical protein